MAYSFDAETSTRFKLTGTIGDDFVDLSDNIIQATEVDPELPQDVDLLAGGIGFFRRIDITGGENHDTVIGGNALLAKIIADGGTGNDWFECGGKEDVVSCGCGDFCGR